MHVIVLLITLFLAPIPASNGHPAQPETAAVQAYIAPSAAACEAGGEALASQLKQSPQVLDARFSCFETVDQNDQAT